MLYDDDLDRWNGGWGGGGGSGRDAQEGGDIYVHKSLIHDFVQQKLTTL